MTPLTDRALDTQLDLVRFYASPMGRKYADAVLASIVPEGRNDEATLDGFGSHLHARIAGLGATYAVSRDICEVLRSAYPSLPSFTLDEWDLPSPVGFVWFEDPIVTRDQTPERKTVVVRALGWHVSLFDRGRTPNEVRFSMIPAEQAHGRMGVTLVAWTDTSDPRDHLYGRLNLQHEELRRIGAVPPQGLVSMLGSLHSFGDRPRATPGLRPDLDPEDDLDGLVWSQTDDLWALLATFLRFIGEPWVEEREEPPSRQAGKRLQRARDKETEELLPRIRVVRLRARKERHEGQEEAGHRHVEWSRRWLVKADEGGFWRKEHYPSLGPAYDDDGEWNPDSHRPKWIRTFEKGPKDKPLIVGDRVFRVDR